MDWGLFVFLLPIAFAIWQGSIYKKRKKLYAIIITGNRRSIHDIAKLCQLDVHSTEKMIQKMINGANRNDVTFKYLRNAYIDPQKKELVLAIDNKEYEILPSKNTLAGLLVGDENVLKKKKGRTFFCKSCEASSYVIPDNGAMCEYCGSSFF